MKKQLLAVGDSFTYGDELPDHYQAWPYKLADAIGYEVYNMGQNGSSNASIFRRTMEELAQTDYDLVVIGWTLPGRIEWKDNIGIEYNIWPGYSTNTKFFDDHPWRADLLNYINCYHNAAYLYEQYLLQIISLQSYFQTRKIDYLMIDVKRTNYYRSAGSELYANLESQINTDKFIGFGHFGMFELCKDLKMAPGGHPLESGHKKIANEIAKHIRN